MKFYVCRDSDDDTFDCVTSLQEAKDIVGAAGGGSIIAMDLPITKETVMQLLGNFGGYARSYRVIEVPTPD